MINIKVKVFSSLISPVLLGGVPRKIALLNGTIGAIFVLVLQNFYLLPVCFMLHFIAIFLCKKDPDFFEISIRHLRQKAYYDV